MTLIEIVLVAASCMLTHTQITCPSVVSLSQTAEVSAPTTRAPARAGESVDVVLTAEAALVWDIETQRVLYEKNAELRRPIASVTKLLTVLTLRDVLNPEQAIEIPADVKMAQTEGAHIRLPIGEHARVHDLYSASLIASANDAVVALAVAAAGSEKAFIETANTYARAHQLADTRAANATGLSGGEQYSTARDVQKMLTAVYADPLLRPLLAEQKGTLDTLEGTRRSYTTTNKLLGTYMPILAAKTGYTTEAGQNLVVITENAHGNRIGAVILGSSDRFQDMKVLVEWIWRNYTWPT